ncbi:hypothetical protein [Sabulibacter ruber]|uniref:hypothetical protein n=1 Tax=Sabulibacter ruber TaxID=2811901 RepID=UPI001A96AF3A|nr:hypothetical protein [Sabulibacter ruber]
MKHILPLFAAFTLFAGVACSTYTSTTDPNDKGSGTALTEDVVTDAPATEAHTTEPAATPAPAATEAKADSAAAPKAEEAAHTEEAAH